MKLSLTLQCLLCLGIGVAAGAAVEWLIPGSSQQVGSGADVVIRGWTNAFRLVAPFLIASQLYVAVAARAPEGHTVARLGLLIPLTFVGLWLLITLLTVAGSSVILKLPLLERLASRAPDLAGLAGVVSPEASAPAAASFSWIDELVPPNLIASASGTNILPLILFTLCLALATRRLAAEPRQSLELVARGLRDAMYILTGWLIQLSPLMLLAFGVQLALTSGLRVGGLLLTFGAIKIVLLLAGTAVLFLLAVLAGPFSPARLARALFPAQLAALATRSSLATVPALLRGAEQLRLPAAVSALVIPLAGSTLKVSRGVSDTLLLFFLARVLGISLSPGQLAVFFLTVLPMTLGTPGLPRAISGARTVPAYVAVGIPAQYVVLFGAVTAITDAFLTLINTTSYQTANVLVARLAGVRRSAEPASDTAIAAADGAVR